MPEILVAVTRQQRNQERNADLRPAMADQFEPLVNRMDEIATTLKRISLELGDKLDDIAARPGHGFGVEEIELKFSLELEIGGGVIIKAGSTAGFEASITWKRS